jgi:glycosyltransferase involved in cell wall biosynthesis
MRVAFPLIGGGSWTGGLNYLVNLLSALAESGDMSITPVLFVGTDQSEKDIAEVLPFLSEPPVRNALWNSGSWTHKERLLRAVLLQRDIQAERAFRAENIDLVFQHSAWYGARFQIPTLAWIADFQHRHLPHLFGNRQFWKRDIGYHALVRSATRILVSSEDAALDCKRFYPAVGDQVSVMPFAPKLIPAQNAVALEEVRTRHALPEKFFYLPNQFWKHKNHSTVIDALQLLKARNKALVVVASGNLKDNRHPRYPQSVLDKVAAYGLAENFRFLGLIPRADISSVMQLATAVLNPSLFEGWSTTVEEAKSLGVPLLLSDLRVHREQAPLVAKYFDPLSAVSMADVMQCAWEEWQPGPRPEAEMEAAWRTTQQRAEFALRFKDIARATIKKEK